MILGFKSDLNFYKSVLLLTNIYQKKFLLLLIVGSKKAQAKIWLYKCSYVNTVLLKQTEHVPIAEEGCLLENNSLFSPWMKLEPKFANYVYLDKALYISIRNLMFRLLIGLTVLTLESNGHTSMQLI